MTRRYNHNTKIIAVRYHPEEVKILDKRRKTKGRSVYIREKSLE